MEGDMTGPRDDRDAETDESPEETARRVRLTVERNMAGRFRPEDAWAVEAVIADITREHLPGASPPDSSAAPVAGDGQVTVDREALEIVLSGQVPFSERVYLPYVNARASLRAALDGGQEA